jgi:hypothetical protein
MSTTANARMLYFTEDIDGTNAETFTINRINTGPTTQLIFGELLGASISFDSNTDTFSISKSIDFNSNQVVNFVLQQGTGFPTGGTAGQLFYRTDRQETFFYDGTQWISNGGGSNTIQFDANIAANTSQTFTHASDPNFGRVMEVLSLKSNDILSSPGWTPYDPLNFTSLDTNANDGTTGSIWYNNSDPNPANKWVGFDSGSSTTVTQFTLYDYLSSASYICVSLDFESSTDGTNWNTDLSITNHTYSPTGYAYTLPTPATGQYFRLKCTTPIHGSYWVIGELEVYTSIGPAKWIRAQSILVELDNPTQTTLTNTGADQDIKLNIILP